MGLQIQFRPSQKPDESVALELDERYTLDEAQELINDALDHNRPVRLLLADGRELKLPTRAFTALTVAVGEL